MKRLLFVVLLVAFALPLSVAAGDHIKATANDVTFSNGTTGELEVGSKITGNDSSYTTCSYFSDDYTESLGYFESAEFASTDSDAVITFCLQHFEDRVTD